MNIKHIISIAVLILSICLSAKAQPIVAQANVIHALSPIDSTKHQFDFLSGYIFNKTVIGLGEASHGTEEFYRIKSALCKYLILEANFKVLALEIDEKVTEEINRYTQGKSHIIKPILQQYGLYSSEELHKLLQWIKSYNHEQKNSANRITIIGFDSEDYWSDPFSRDSLMAENFLSKISDQKCILWAHNAHLVKSNTWDTSNTGIKAMGNYLADKFGNAYYMIALDTEQGTLNTIENGRLEPYDFILEKTLLDNSPNFFIAFNSVDEASQYELTNLSSNQQGNPQLVPTILGKDIDALIFIKETTASKPID